MTSAPTQILTEKPPVLPPARRTTRGWRLVAGVGAIALAAGFGGGYAAGYANQPEPVTKTVTQILTVPAAPYASTLAQTVYVTYDGVHAYYAGPAQVTAGTTMTFHVVQNAAHPVGVIAVGQMPDTYTWEDGLAWFRDHPLLAETPSDARVRGYATTDQGDLVLTLGSGLYAVVIGTPPEATSQGVFVTLLLVSGAVDHGQRSFREG